MWIWMGAQPFYSLFLLFFPPSLSHWQLIYLRAHVLCAHILNQNRTMHRRGQLLFTFPCRGFDDNLATFAKYLVTLKTQWGMFYFFLENKSRARIWWLLGWTLTTFCREETPEWHAPFVRGAKSMFWRIYHWMKAIWINWAKFSIGFDSIASYLIFFQIAIS